MAVRARFVVVLLVVLSGFLGLPHTTVALTNCTVSAADQALDDVELQLFALINDYRAENGRNRLILRTDAARASSWFSRDMAAGNYFPANHTDSLGRDPAARLAQCDVPWSSYNENLAAGQTTALAAFNAWKNSPGHNTNMLSTTVTHGGVARAYNAASTYGWYWTLNLITPNPVPDLAEDADFDEDSKADIAVWRGNPGVWYVQRSGGGTTTQSWGDSYAHDDVPVPADYDGDGKIDIAVWRPNPGVWYIRHSATGTTSATYWGDRQVHNDIPVPGDYDGDKIADLAVWRGNPGVWYVLRSSDGGTTTRSWGDSYAHNDVPVPSDYDGDGKTDFAVWRPNPGVWYIVRSSDATTTATYWGDRQVHSDIPVPGDYDGDNKTDIAVWRGNPGVWYIQRSSGGTTTQSWGDSYVHDDVPVPSDYDGDGKTDIAVWRGNPGVWYVLRSGGGNTATSWGDSYVHDDVPLVLPFAIRNTL